MPNRLALETSPYLLQHAENPVDWYPWGPEALGLALELDRPILLSVGYSACHWCHVMEHESFEDDVTAALMNEHFVNIKVDREERPDVDAVYMKAVQTLTGGGGWPMTVFLTPSGKPFYGGTYFPPEPRHGLPSFAQVLQAMERAYREQRDDVTQAAEALTRALRHASEERRPVDGSGSVRVEAPPATADASIFDGAFRALAGAYDPTHGGFGRAPKFPQPTTLEFLLRWYAGRPHDPAGKQALDMVTVTLRKMARGGLRDHLGGGFHRYSVDDRWLVPHFEKMLYDNALLARLYIHAWSVTGDSEMRLAGEDTLDWLLTDMRSPEGGFYSARDADSEGVEGRFYVWSLDEIEEVLGSEDTELFALAYDVTVGGNFEGSNILHRPHDLPAIARRADLSTDELELRLSENRQRLLAARGQRPPPLRDHKVLASWNAFAIRALAEAGGALGRRDYLDAAEATLDFLLTDMRPDGRLMHVWTEGQAKISGFLQDYGAVGNAVLTVYEATLEPRWLGELRGIVDIMLAQFRDPGSGLFFDTDGEAPESAELVVRPRDVTDGATPSGTALALELLQRAGRLLDEQTWIGIVQEGLSREEEVVRRFPSALGRLLSVGLNELDPPIEVALIGDREDPALRCLHHEVLRRFIPGRTVAGRRPDEELPEKLPLLRDRTTLEGRPAAYLCEHYVCREPTHDPDVLSGQLDNHGFTAP